MSSSLQEHKNIAEICPRITFSPPFVKLCTGNNATQVTLSEAY
jgi:hypothetical protein